MTFRRLSTKIIIGTSAALFLASPTVSMLGAPCHVSPKRKIRLDCTGTRFAAAYCGDLENFINDDAANAIDKSGAQPTLAVRYDSLADPSHFPFRALQALSLESAISDVGKSFISALAAWEAARLDKQSGAGPTSSASTALVSKPGASGLLSLAIESGAFTSSVNGTSMTLNGNVANAYQLITNGNPFPNEIMASNCPNTLRNINISGTFTLDQTSPTTTPTAGAATSTTQTLNSVVLPTSSASLQSFSVRWNFYHSLDPSGKVFQDAWKTEALAAMPDMKTAGKDFSNKAAKLISATMTSDATFAALQTKFVPILIADYKAQNGKQLVHDYDSYLQQYFAHAKENNPQQFDSLVVSAVTSMATFIQLNQQIIDHARGIPILTAQYTFSRPPSQPDTHDFTMIFAEAWKSGGQITANGAASIYNSVPAGANYGRLRDVQVSAELDQTIGNKTAPPVVLSIAGYGQYQYDPSVLNITSANLAPGTNITLPANAQVLLGTAGWLGIVQGKVTLNLQKSISIPLAVKWSNKTDLLQAQDVRGQIGISYDFSSLLKQQ